MLCAIVAVFIFSCATTSEPPLIPREVLLGNPVKTSPQISPDGAMMAYLAPVDNVLNVWVRSIDAEDDKPVTKDDDRGIRRYFWAADSKHIMYLQDVGGNENFRLYAVNLETDEIRDLTPYEDVQVRIVDRNKHFPNELLIAMNKENPQVHDVYHLDLTSGELVLVAKNPGNVLGWVTDADFKVRGNLAATPDGGYDLMIRDNEDAEWKKLISWDSENTLTSGPICFSKDGKYLYLLDSRDVNAGRLVKFEIATGNIEVIAEDPQYDVSDAIIHPDTYEIQAVSFTKDRKEWTVLDESIRGDFEAIAKLDHGDYFVYNRDNADDTWLVGFTKDNGPLSYYALDRKTKKGTFLFDNRPDLNNYTLASIEPISFESRDGLTIHGYITYPPGKGRTNLPMVLNVHGGPWYRDTWGYNPEAQWFANRGYVCLQVNFRGSTGYGKDFVNAADKEWGGKMHDDLVDGVNWAIEKGIADPEKVAIYGGSYGGYAALVGATFTPDLFCCAVDIVGPSNLKTWITSVPPYWSAMLALLYKRIGNPDTEEEFLNSRSPLFKVDQIKIPMLIAQGANDPRVPQPESEQIVEALKEKGIEHEYMLFEDEGHGFAKPENRLKFYAAAEKFLAKHLGGRCEEVKEGAE
ncbi:MAG: S9 family peptidase [candidate division Zixibacteria bacterium]|nr:S9 family peptidase [candidate division Zixibacteria bacterium]